MRSRNAAAPGVLVSTASLPTDPEPDETEYIAKLRRSMADFEAGRYRLAKDVMREIAAEHGFALEG